MTSTRVAVATALIVTACLAAAEPARAQPARAEPAPSEQRGIELFEKGRELARDGRCAEAVPFLTASLEQAAAVGPLLNLGHCYELLGKTASAADAFARAAQVAGQRGDPRKHEALERERALEPVLSTLRVVVPRSIQPSVTELRDRRLAAPAHAMGRRATHRPRATHHRDRVHGTRASIGNRRRRRPRRSCVLCRVPARALAGPSGRPRR